jgi:hypothetical protein
MLLTHRRQREATPRRGSQRDRSPTVSPGPEAFPEGTLEIALVCTGREDAVATTLPCSDFVSGRLGDLPSVSLGGRVVPRGMPQGRGVYPTENNLLRIDS